MTTLKIYQDHPRADVALISIEGTIFKVRQKVLEAQSIMWDDMADVATHSDAEKVEDLPALRIEAPADGMDLVLAMFHGQLLPVQIPGSIWLQAYAICDMWNAEGTMNRIRVRMPVMDKTQGAEIFAAAARYHDETLMRATTWHIITPKFCTDVPLGSLPYGPDGNKLALQCFWSRSELTRKFLIDVVCAKTQAYCTNCADDYLSLASGVEELCQALRDHIILTMKPLESLVSKLTVSSHCTAAERYTAPFTISGSGNKRARSTTSAPCPNRRLRDVVVGAITAIKADDAFALEPLNKLRKIVA